MNKTERIKQLEVHCTELKIKQSVYKVQQQDLETRLSECKLRIKQLENINEDHFTRLEIRDKQVHHWQNLYLKLKRKVDGFVDCLSDDDIDFVP